jgi:membrane-bound serine protease (ClpP class)
VALGVALLLGTARSSPAAPTVAGTPAPAPPAHVDLLRVDGSINPGVADYVRYGIERAQEDGAAAVVLEIDTPGGLLASARTIVKDILGAAVPVIAYVAPSGAGAGSAGVFIVMAADVAAMAPGTNIGASTPIESNGGDIKGALGEKVRSFTASFAKTIAARRGRNVEWAGRAVREAVSATDVEAQKLGVVDLIAADVPDLLRQASGRRITVGGVSRTLDLASARVDVIAMQPRQRVLALLADPNVAYLLMLAGLLGLYLELSHPGTFLPGVAGAICLLVALAAFQVLPINTTGLALLGLGVALLVAELFVPSFGVIGIGGVIAFVLGSVLLFDASGTGLAVDRGLIGAAASAVGLTMLTLATLVVRAMRRRTMTGKEALVGEVCEVRTSLAPRGSVFLRGELWEAVADRPIDAGARARVVGVDGLTLHVAPCEEGGNRE